MARPTQHLSKRFQAAPGNPLTVDDVVVSAGLWLGFAALAAVLGWLTAPVFFGAVSPWLLLVGFVALAFLDYRIYKAHHPPLGLMAVSLGGYGYLVGAISWGFSVGSGDGGLGLVGTAAAATLVTAVVVIALYKAKVLRAEKSSFRNTVIAATFGYAVVIVVSLLMQAFGGASLFMHGPLGLLLCAVGAVLAALSLSLAAADIDIAIAHGAPVSEASRLGWAFVSTLLWLYLEILRLVARIDD